MKKALQEPVLYIWGPPGTGKTETLSRIAINHLAKGHRVLVISHSNVAVDEAIRRIYKKIWEPGTPKNFKYKPGSILRYGYPKMPDVRNNEELTSFNLVLRKYPELKKQKEELEQQRFIIKKQRLNDPELAKVSKELTVLKRRIKELESQFLQDAKLVATSLAKATIDSCIYDSHFDVVLLDEVSMAYIPQAFYAASLAKKHIIYIGDFRQLAPIALSDDEKVKKWLKRDVFEQAKIKEGVDERRYHPLMVMLDVQRRMHPKISGFVSYHIYHGLLNDDPAMAQKTEDIKKSTPMLGENLSLINVRLFPAFCYKDSSGSRYNPFTALVSLYLALQALPSKTSKQLEEDSPIGIITPYSTQSRLVRSMIRDVFREENLSKLPIFAATVHQFQGSEKDIIIFDCVDNYPQERPGVLLTSDNLEQATRLINVAVSRARGKFVAITNRSYWKSKINNDKILSVLLRYLEEKGRQYASYDLENYLLKPLELKHALQFYSKGNYKEHFIYDLRNARGSIYMDIPEGTLVDTSWLKYLQDVQKRGVQLKIRAGKPADLPSPLNHYAELKYFVPAPLIIIDQEIIWYGQPLVKKDKVEYFVSVRFKGKRTAQMLTTLLGTGSGVGLGFNEFIGSNEKCPNCGRPLRIVENPKNRKLLLGCTGYPKCNYIFPYIPVDLVNKYLTTTQKVCHKCGSPFYARVSQYGLYISCENFWACKNKISVKDL
ncbi:MAG: AAA domain-containing protein [Bacillota bacterium]